MFTFFTSMHKSVDNQKQKVTDYGKLN